MITINLRGKKGFCRVFYAKEEFSVLGCAKLGIPKDKIIHRSQLGGGGGGGEKLLTDFKKGKCHTTLVSL